MKIRFNFFTSIPAFLMWMWCIYRIYTDYDHYNFSDGLIQMVLIGIAFAFSIAVFIGDRSQYKEEKGMLSFVPTGVNALCVIALWLTLVSLKRQDDTPTVLYGVTGHLPSFYQSLDLRKNNTYKFGRHRGFSGEYIRGRYSRKDSIIYLESGIPYPLVSDRLVLRAIPLSDSLIKTRRNSLLNLFTRRHEPDTIPGLFILQVDKNGKILDSITYFEVGAALF